MTSRRPAREVVGTTPGTLTRQGQFLAGDGVRGMGMVCVLFAHLAPGALVLVGVYSLGMRAAYGTVPGILMSGLQLAVPMFFVLSAYLISRPWVRAYVLGRRTPSLRAYLLHRVLRIVPVFWLLTALTLIAFGAHGSSPLDLLTIFGFGQIYHASGASLFVGQAWTIDMEVGFYLLVPPSAWLLTYATRRWAKATGRDLSQRARIALVTALLAVLTLASAWLRGDTIGSLWNASPPATFYYFGPGIALAALEIGVAGPVARRRLRAVPPIFGVSAAVLAVLLAISESTDDDAIIRGRAAAAVALASGLALAALLARQLARGDSPPWVDNRVTRWLGARSYPCYIVQTATVALAVLILGRGSSPWLEFL
ncbi:MAG TPA: acyltransferase, partial [Solirubrobacteraceae bacterium]|nr:acyltransferase [Solirubrobacteraceae bacterium]